MNYILTIEYSVAFIDLLGFKYFVNKDLLGALSLIENTHETLKESIIDENIHPASTYSDPGLKALAEKSFVDSFNIFLPFSDSIIILSENPNKFICQLSNFIYKCFHLTSHIYPTAKEGKNGEIEVTDNIEHWFPTLFRGGISFGKVNLFESPMVIEGKVNALPNVVGIPYIKAIKLEQSGKGPRLFCDDSFVSQLSMENKRFIVPVNNNESKEQTYEILWPAFRYIEGNPPQVEANDFSEYYLPAVALANHYKDAETVEHYHQFKILLIRSTLVYFRAIGFEQIGRDTINRFVNDREILREIPEW